MLIELTVEACDGYRSLMVVPESEVVRECAWWICHNWRIVRASRVA